MGRSARWARDRHHTCGRVNKRRGDSGRPSAPNTHERHNTWASDERARATATGAPTHEGVTTPHGRRAGEVTKQTDAFMWAWAHAKTNRGSARVGRAPLIPTRGSARVGGRPSPVTRRFNEGVGVMGGSARVASDPTLQETNAYKCSGVGEQTNNRSSTTKTASHSKKRNSELRLSVDAPAERVVEGRRTSRAERSEGLGGARCCG